MKPVRPPAHWAALLVAVGVLPFVLDAGGDTRRGTERFDDFAPLVRRVMERDHVPGVAVGVVDRGHLVFARGFGYRDVENQLPMTPDTLFALGSASGPPRRLSRPRPSRCSPTRERSRSTLPCAPTFPISPSKTRSRRRR